MRKTLLGVAFCVFGVVTAWAADIGGVKVDDKVSVGGQELVLNGGGVRTRVFVKVYVGTLYLPAKATTLAAVLEKAPRRIQMNMLRDLSPDQLIGALSDGIKDNTPAAEQAAIKPQMDQMITVMKGFGEVKEKDIVTLDFVDGATRIGMNGTTRGSIPGDAFNRALTRIWLGDNPAQADLKKAMLGG